MFLVVSLAGVACKYYDEVSIKYVILSCSKGMWFQEDSNKKEFIKISQQQFSERYQLVQSLGKGSYGQVYRARSHHGNIVAIKQFRSQAMQQFHMIIREISNLRRLDHPNILKFYDCYIVDDYRYYMVTQFCPGGALTDYITQVTTQHGKMLLCLQMAQGLAYAHDKGIVHRDLKPENILIGQRNVAKIGDFGCSTRLDEGSMVSRVGSPAYMDYRPGRGKDYDYTVDLYSLGMVFLWVFSGKGIYDQFSTLTELNRFQSQISNDYQNRIQPYIDPLPAPINSIVKNWLSPEYQVRLPVRKIADLISASISKESSNMASTQDELDGLESNRLHFAYTLMAFHKDFERRYRNEKIRDSTLQLLLRNQQALQKLKAVSELRYVSTDTKAKFAFLVFLYYLCWLEQLGLFMEGKPSQVAKRYPYIDPKAADADLQELVQKHIRKEKERVSLAILKCSEKIQGTLHLVATDRYLPPHFKDFVRKVYNQETIPLNLLQEKEHLDSVEEFYRRWVKAQYDYTRGNEGEPDKAIQVVGEISRSFQ